MESPWNSLGYYQVPLFLVSSGNLAASKFEVYVGNMRKFLIIKVQRLWHLKR